MSLHLLYREIDETAHRHEGSHWGGMQEGQRNASSTSNGGESRGTASSITSPTGIPRKLSFTISPPLRPRESVAEHSRNGSHLLQQTLLFLSIIPNIPEVWTDTTAHHKPQGGPLSPGQRLPAGALIRKPRFVAQCRREAGRTDIFT